MTDITRGFHLTVTAPANVKDEVIANYINSGMRESLQWATSHPSADRHQDYANYPTFVVAMWFENDQERITRARRLGAFLVEQECEFPDVELAKWLREFTEESMPESDGDNVSESLLNYSLGTVDWLELAREYMKEEGQ